MDHTAWREGVAAGEASRKFLDDVQEERGDVGTTWRCWSVCKLEVCRSIVLSWVRHLCARSLYAGAAADLRSLPGLNMTDESTAIPFTTLYRL